MKRSFTAFWRRNLALAKLAIVSNLEYRFNFVIDAFIQPMLSVGVEVLLWLAIFSTAENGLIGGFDKNHYLAYAIWAPFLGRLAISWMYESMMTEEVVSGSINTILSRPLSFFEYYLSQTYGYKLITAAFSIPFPILTCLYFDLPINYGKIPLAMALVFYYIVLVHTMSFMVSSLGFFVTRVRSFTLVKNLILVLLCGELVPFDLMSPTMSKIVTALPFASGVYIPLAYITERAGFELIVEGFKSVTISLIVCGLISAWLWKKGVKEYTGTGA